MIRTFSKKSRIDHAVPASTVVCECDLKFDLANNQNFELSFVQVSL